MTLRITFDEMYNLTPADDADDVLALTAEMAAEAEMAALEGVAPVAADAGGGTQDGVIGPPAAPSSEAPAGGGAPPTLAYATAPRLRPWRGFAVAACAHLAVLALVVAAAHFRPPAPRPDGPPISIEVVETPPAGDAQRVTPQPPKAQVAPPPSPVPLPQAVKPDIETAKQAPPPKPVRQAAAPAAAPAAGRATQAARVTQANSGITRPAKADDETTVFYSMYSREAGQQGQVRLSVVVLADGMPGQVTVLTSSGFRDLDNLARNNVMTWHFEPAMKNGVAVTSELTYVFKFALQ